MISFSNGLVLRRGERTLQFERHLDVGNVQFRYLDTNGICTLSLAALYADILGGTVRTVPRDTTQGMHCPQRRRRSS